VLPHAVLVAYELHGLGVPRQVELLDQEQPLAERHVVLAALLAQVVGVPAQVPVSLAQLQPLADKQVLDAVLSAQAGMVPLQVPAAVDQLQP
jgi:hypothetical protein